MVVRLIRQLFAQQSLSEQLRKERELEMGTEDLDRRRPLGNVLVFASQYFPLSSSIIPLACSIAAGNSTLLLLSMETPNISKLIVQLLEKSPLDADAVAIVLPESKKDMTEIITALKDSEFHGIVAQQAEQLEVLEQVDLVSKKPGTRVLSCVPDANTVVVTRYADVAKATEDIMQAFLIQPTLGASSAAPVIFVDEFVLADFESVAVKVMSQGQNRSNLNGGTKASMQSNELSVDQISEFKDKRGRVLSLPGRVTMLIGDPNWK